MKNIVILANGAFPSNPDVLRLLNLASVIVCCDGASSHLLEWDFHEKQCFIVGDGDSTIDSVQQRFAPIFFHNPDQETNDLTKAIHFCLSKGWTKVTILGATGLREDHTLGNISLLADYYDMGIEAQIVSDYGTFSILSGTKEFPSFPRQQVSLFSLTPSEPISVQGLEYPILNRPLRRWWEGTLNSSLGNHFIVETTPSARIIVYQTHLPKQ